MDYQENQQEEDSHQTKQQCQERRSTTTADDGPTSNVAHHGAADELELKKKQDEDENTNDSSSRHHLPNQGLYVSTSNVSSSINKTKEDTADSVLKSLPTPLGASNQDDEIRIPSKLNEEGFRIGEQAAMAVRSLLGTEGGGKINQVLQNQRNDDETKRTQGVPLSFTDNKRKSFYHPGLLDSSEAEVSHIASGINLGRRGDPRMHKAVSVRLANPTMSLLEALVEGGFQFPPHELAASSGKSDRDILDEDGVQLCQRKNQLSRRLRLIRKKQEGHAEFDSSLDANKGSILHQELYPAHVIMEPIAAVSKVNPFSTLDISTLDTRAQEERHRHNLVVPPLDTIHQAKNQNQITSSYPLQRQERPLSTTSDIQRPQHFEQQQQDQRQRILERKYSPQQIVTGCPPRVFPSFAASANPSSRGRTVDEEEFASYSSYPPQHHHSEANVYDNTSTTKTGSLLDLLLKESQAQRHAEAVLLDLITGKYDTRKRTWNDANALTGVMGNIGAQSSVYPTSTTTQQFVGSSHEQQRHSATTNSPSSRAKLDSFYKRPGTQLSLHQLLQESAGSIGNTSSSSHPNEQERYLSALVAILAKHGEDQNRHGMFPMPPNNQQQQQPTYASTNLISNTYNQIPSYPALRQTNLQQSMNDDAANSFLANQQCLSCPMPGVMPALLESHRNDSILALSLMGQLAFEEKLTFAVDIFKSLRRGLIMECLKTAGFTESDVISNNELLLMLFERKLNAALHLPTGSGEESANKEEEMEGKYG
eukprot:CAMPEP_0176483644 /NCGR_PEP_ID=MMETSP0200_2-20121128/4029_1 /TAXON_ID=947934 /ORGANISM="Chaetoceros sp., Strain GSL56" /LENGTH=763 /DNA_ID=CAMNT_0017880061 /DNA_START=598 /DNA_END=2889 /DNA_ORIENTATION=-